QAVNQLGAAPAQRAAPKGWNCQTVGGYAELIVEVMVLNVALICEPSPRAAAMMPTAIRAAMRPYSMAVAPDSSFTKRMAWFCMTGSPKLFGGLAGATPCDGDYGVILSKELRRPRTVTAS